MGRTNARNNLKPTPLARGGEVYGGPCFAFAPLGLPFRRNLEVSVAIDESRQGGLPLFQNDDISQAYRADAARV
jgi:hypothetical protein